MATGKHQHDKDPEKTVDVPPYGSRNPDPLTDSPGSHPIETGVGAVLGGVASGLAVGTLTGGPVGAVVGAIAGGAAAGGLAGKGVGELIDPTTEDNWIREYFGSDEGKAVVQKGETTDAYRPAFRYGLQSGTASGHRPFEEAETDLRSEWERSHASTTGMGWDRIRGAVRHAYDRTIKLHEERLKVDKDTVRTGDVSVRKEVHTEHKTITVPVEREEVVIERRAVHGGTTGGDIKAEEIRIPTKEERVHVSKEAVVKEEVSVGKRKVRDTQTVSGDVRKEELVVENEGKAKVRTDKK